MLKHSDTMNKLWYLFQQDVYKFCLLSPILTITHTHISRPKRGHPTYCQRLMQCQSTEVLIITQEKSFGLGSVGGVPYLWEKLSEKTRRPCEKYKPLSLSTDGNVLGVHITTKLERHICKDEARQNATGTK